MPISTRVIVVAALLASSSVVHADRLIGYRIGDQNIFQVDTDTGDVQWFSGHNMLWLGGIDVHDGDLYYLGFNTLYKIDIGKPANDEYIGMIEDAAFESFEIINGVGYSGHVFDGRFFTIDLNTAEATFVGFYGSGGGDRITGLASSDFGKNTGQINMYGQRVFLDDLIRVDPKTGQNLGILIADPLLSTTNLASGADGQLWYINGSNNTLYRIDLANNGTITPWLTDIPNADGLTAIEPKPTITTDELPAAFVDEPYGPVQIQHVDGTPRVEWILRADTYEEINTGENGWEMIGAGQNWTADDGSWHYGLPFAFPFYGEAYTQAWISNNGFIDFALSDPSSDNSTAALIANIRIAPLWDDLRTDFGGRDVFIDESTPGQVTIRWDALHDPDFGVVNFSCTLLADGTIEFHYWLPNQNLSPTVGISAGNGADFIIAEYDGLADLHTKDTLRFATQALPDGLTLSSDGLLTGTPTEAGVFMPTMRVVDDFGGWDEVTLTLVVSETPPCPADLFEDGTVDVLDLLSLLSGWDTPGPGDITGPDGQPDGIVDVLDLLMLLGEWGDC